MSTGTRYKRWVRSVSQSPMPTGSLLIRGLVGGNHDDCPDGQLYRLPIVAAVTAVVAEANVRLEDLERWPSPVDAANAGIRVSESIQTGFIYVGFCPHSWDGHPGQRVLVSTLDESFVEPTEVVSSVFAPTGIGHIDMEARDLAEEFVRSKMREAAPSPVLEGIA